MENSNEKQKCCGLCGMNRGKCKLTPMCECCKETRKDSLSLIKEKIKKMPIYHTLKIEDEEYYLISKVDVLNIINNS